MPRITLPSASGSLFDSWDPMTSGLARVYWLGAPPTASAAAQLADTLAACETLLHIVAATPPEVPGSYPSWLLDRAGELGRVFGAIGPLAIVVDTAGRVAALLPAPTPDGVAALATRLYMASTPAVVQAKAPVLLLSGWSSQPVQTLIEYWQRGDKAANEVGSATGASSMST
jgi:hypothetical protein